MCVLRPMDEVRRIFNSGESVGEFQWGQVGKPDQPDQQADQLASSSHHLWNQQIKFRSPSSLCTLWPLCCHLSNYSQIFCNRKACNSDIVGNKLKIFEKSSLNHFTHFCCCKFSLYCSSCLLFTNSISTELIIKLFK